MDDEAKKIRDTLGQINAKSFIGIRRDAVFLLNAPKAGKGRGNKPRGSTREARLQAALDLIARCADMTVPPPTALVKLLSEIVDCSPNVMPTDHRRPNLTTGQWNAIGVLINSPSFHFDWKDGILPTKLSSRQLQELVGVSHVTIMKWWKDPEFRRGLFWRMFEEIELP